MGSCEGELAPKSTLFRGSKKKEVNKNVYFKTEDCEEDLFESQADSENYVFHPNMKE